MTSPKFEEPSRFRVGFVVPSSNTTIETEVPELLRRYEAAAHRDLFSFHSSRVRMNKVTAEELRSMNAQMELATKVLGDASCDVVASACLVAVMAQGAQFHYTIERDMREWLDGKPALSSAGALVSGLREIGAKNIAVITPYSDELTDIVCDYITDEHYNVVNRLNLNVQDNRAVGLLDQNELLRLATEIDVEGCDALVLSACVQMPSLRVLQQVENAIGRPVLSAASATAFGILKNLNLRTSIPDAGWLLSSNRLEGKPFSGNYSAQAVIALNQTN